MMDQSEWSRYRRMIYSDYSGLLTNALHKLSYSKSTGANLVCQVRSRNISTNYNVLGCLFQNSHFWTMSVSPTAIDSLK